MILKPQDVVVLLKLCGYMFGDRPSYSVMARELEMSASEVHSAVKRLCQSRLIHGAEMNEKPIMTAVEEFLIHGVKYAFPAIRGSLTRGIPTSYAAEPLCRLINSGNEAVPVWADPNGKVRGIEIVPLYKTVPAAAMRDQKLYERLALIDALRDGRARDRNLAEQELKKSLKNYGSCEY